MVRVKTFVNEEEYLTYSADGVMVATPTGSTGYNFSAGGPVVDASSALMILTPDRTPLHHRSIHRRTRGQRDSPTGG